MDPNDIRLLPEPCSCTFGARTQNRPGDVGQTALTARLHRSRRQAMVCQSRQWNVVLLPLCFAAFTVNFGGVRHGGSPLTYSLVWGGSLICLSERQQGFLTSPRCQTIPPFICCHFLLCLQREDLVTLWCEGSPCEVVKLLGPDNANTKRGKRRRAPTDWGTNIFVLR